MFVIPGTVCFTAKGILAHHRGLCHLHLSQQTVKFADRVRPAVMAKRGLIEIINAAPAPPRQWPQFNSQCVGPRCRQSLWPQSVMMLMLCEKVT